MSHSSARTRAAAIAATLGLATLLTVGVTPQAHAANPAGSATELFVEAGGQTGDPANAVTAGCWGHEGPNRDQGSYPDADLRDGGQGFLDAFGTDSYDNFALVFAPASTDGSTEEPTITAGETVGQAYQWFTDIGFGTGFSGTVNPATNEVLKVSTMSEYQAWINDGKPDQQASSNDLVMHDPLRTGNPVSVAPKGKSILNRWATGQDLSMILVQTTGARDANGLPIVAADANGHANAAWLHFTTALDPHIGDAAHQNIGTSGCYTVTSTVTTPTVALSDQWTGDTATLTATVKGASGTLTDATGTMQFYALPKNQDLGSYAAVGAPVTVTAGVASTPVTGIAAGEFQKYKATYTPDAAASTTYAAADSSPRTLTRPATATTTGLVVSGGLVAGAKQTLTATVSPSGATGSVQLKDGTKLLATVPLSAGKATKSVALAAGKHTLRATYVPSGSGYTGSASPAKTVTIAKARATIVATLSPTAVRKGTRPKLLVTVKATGLVPAGKVTVKVKAPNGSVKTVSATLRSGKATIVLPPAVKGKQVLTITYAGSAAILPASKSLTYTAR